jgi:hypothetical protein
MRRGAAVIGTRGVSQENIVSFTHNNFKRKAREIAELLCVCNQ